MSWGWTNNRVALVPLREWADGDFRQQFSQQQTRGHGKEAMGKHTLFLNTTVAYGIGELLRKARSHHYSAFPQTCHTSLDSQCNIDNFVVRTEGAGQDQGSQPTWKGIEGVDMLSPRLSVNIVEPSFLREVNDGDGRYLEAEFPSHPDADDATVFFNQCEEDHRCHSFGVLLRELFSRCSPTSAEDTRGIGFYRTEDEPGSTSNNSDAPREPARKKTKSVGLTAARAIRQDSYSALQRGAYVASSEEGLPSSIRIVIQNLLDCGENDRPDNAYDSLDEVINDLHLLLLNPSRFLFDNVPIYDELGNPQLSFREHKLYGRDNEVSLIEDTFCRVSSGQSESLFMGGFSGSGKTRIVNGLRARVDVVGGYVLTHKFDQMSQEKPMLEVIAMFNDLCLLIRDKNSQQDLLVIVNDIVNDFGSDLYVLARLLPNIKALIPQLLPSDDEQKSQNQTNLQSICFTLQRFIRAVSSGAHPVVLFLDDLQWCDKSALTVVESLLCDAVGSTCIFFVGTYRSNEVPDDHELFRLAQRLTSFGVPTTMLSLEGLNPKDLNTMISDAMHMFPRISEPLSDIVYQKTKGNPFFVRAFLKSLVDGGLLKYNICTKRWVWDEDDVCSMDVTDNVLYLLSSKMSGLSPRIQSALKIAACFGRKIRESVVAVLGNVPEQSDIRDRLEQIVKEGFMVKGDTSDFVFVHDKVREAAYSLIPETEKDKFHYSLGLSLYSMTKGKLVDDLIISIADQIKHGIDKIKDYPELRIGIAEINELAGMQAAACSDHVASRSYLTYALTLLPTDHWKSNYDLSLRVSLRMAKSCYSCGDVGKAQRILQEVTGQCHSIEDKIPAYALLARKCKSFMEAYTLCHGVLSQLGEEVPDSLQLSQVSEMVVLTLKMVHKISDKDLLEMKEIDIKVNHCMNFYYIMNKAAFFGKPEMLPVVACRMTQLTMENGLCKYSIVGLVEFASVICLNKFAFSKKIEKNVIESASRIGKAAMSCSTTRYPTTEQLPNLYLAYYGFLAHHTVPLHICADMLRQGFDVGMSLGDPGVAFFNSIQHIKTAFIAGNRLPTLLEKVDYYLKLTNTYKNEIAKVFLSLQRETISILIDNEGTSSSTPQAIDAPTNSTNAHLIELMYYHRAIQAYWRGHSERCQHYIGKFLQSSFQAGKLISMVIVFIHGMNSFQLLKRRSSIKNTSISKKSIRALKTAAKHSSWNFINKVLLLEAEEFSHSGSKDEAKASYVAAISSARSSGFIHEQGLACELAGYHSKNVGDGSSAWVFFNQAKQCYTEWGSQLKVKSVTQQLDSLSDYMPVRDDAISLTLGDNPVPEN